MTRILARFFLTFLVAWGLLTAPAAARSLESPVEDQFIRLHRDADRQPVALKTAIVRFVPSDSPDSGQYVDLIGVIHVGEAAYFQELNRRFRGYDAVLYELVAPEEATVPVPGERPGTLVGGVQLGMTAMLELAYQLDHIDYTAPNMVHADMTPEEFARSMRARNESFAGYFFRMLGRSLGEQAREPWGSSDLRMLAAMLAEDRAHRMRLILAEEFSELGGQLELFDGPEGSTIVTDRNTKALEVLRRELAAGRRRLAIFYGAGHLADFQRRLQAEFGMQRAGVEWVPAWSLTPPEP